LRLRKGVRVIKKLLIKERVKGLKIKVREKEKKKKIWEKLEVLLKKFKSFRISNYFYLVLIFLKF